MRRGGVRNPSGGGVKGVKVAQLTAAKFKTRLKNEEKKEKKNTSHVTSLSLVFSGLQSVIHKLSTVAEIFSLFPTKTNFLGNLKAKDNK